MCAGAWTRCCSGGARSTEVVAALAALHSWTLVSAPRLSSTLPNDACRRRFSSGDGSRVSRVGFGPLFLAQDGWRGMMVASKGGRRSSTSLR